MPQSFSERMVGDISVLHQKMHSFEDHTESNYNGFQPSTTILPKGHSKESGRRNFEISTLWERDNEIPMRDGTVLRADVFRPAKWHEPVPALVAYAPFGKSGTGVHQLDLVPGRAGIPRHALSGYENFEAPDPAEWCPHGYAVVNIDDRGIFQSQGNHRWHGTAQGEDGYDAVEHIASLPWCTGSVALIGNSWLATSQWFIASQRPPHLTCILPLEGLSDVYRETLCRGGVPYIPFWKWLMNNLRGHNHQEDIVAMIRKHPLMNSYWDDKRAKAHLINVPTYVLASMSTGLHTVGSLRGFEDIPHNQKWLRMHPTQEWHDLYQKETIEDLRKFLDFYTKGVANGWEKMPKVRVSFIRYDQPPIYNIPFADWPIPEARHKKLWLSGEKVLKESSKDTREGMASYQSDAPSDQTDTDTEHAEWVYTFREKTRMIGPARATLYMSCADHNDMDIFVIVRKADHNGKVLRNLNIPLEQLPFAKDEEVPDLNILKYIGPSGILRASHRAIDTQLSKPHWHVHDHSYEDKISPGEVVKVEIMLWPAAIQFEAGEKLVVRVAGHQMTLAEFPQLRGEFLTENKGRHYVHFGSVYGSFIEIPLVELSG